MLASNPDYFNLLLNTIFERKFLSLSEKYLEGRLINIGYGEKSDINMLSSYFEDYINVDII